MTLNVIECLHQIKACSKDNQFQPYDGKIKIKYKQEYLYSVHFAQKLKKFWWSSWAERKNWELFTFCTTHYTHKTTINLIRDKPRIYVP